MRPRVRLRRVPVVFVLFIVKQDVAFSIPAADAPVRLSFTHEGEIVPRAGIMVTGEVFVCLRGLLKDLISTHFFTLLYSVHILRVTGMSIFPTNSSDV